MPIANIYSSPALLTTVEREMRGLRRHIAAALTTAEIVLTDDHVSIRLLPAGGAMIGEIEVELLAHSFPGRILRQDEICTSIRTYMENRFGNVQIRVWLILSEMGYAYNRNQNEDE
jgi:hypothetical protein